MGTSGPHTDHVSRAEKEKVQMRVVELEAFIEGQGLGIPGGKSKMSFHVFRDPRERIKQSRPEEGVTWRLLYKPNQDRGPNSLCWELYQLARGEYAGNGDIVDNAGNRWTPRMLTHDREGAISELMRRNNGVVVV